MVGRMGGWMLISVCAWVHFWMLSNTGARIIAIAVVALLSDVLVVVFSFSTGNASLVFPRSPIFEGMSC